MDPADTVRIATPGARPADVVRRVQADLARDLPVGLHLIPTGDGFRATYEGPWRALRIDVAAAAEDVTVETLVVGKHPRDVLRTDVPMVAAVLVGFLGVVGATAQFPSIGFLIRMGQTLGVVIGLAAGAASFWLARWVLAPVAAVLAPALARRREARVGPESADASRVAWFREAVLAAARAAAATR